MKITKKISRDIQINDYDNTICGQTCIHRKEYAIKEYIGISPLLVTYCLLYQTFIVCAERCEKCMKEFGKDKSKKGGKK